MAQTLATQSKENIFEFTLRGVILGSLITLVFTASNVYLGLKVGLTFATSIPAAVISMAILKNFANSNILENNIVQTIASAAGCLSAVIFVIPGLVMAKYWMGFPFWQTFLICAIGGMLGVLYTIPLRRAMIVNSPLPYPEGVAAAEILKVGSQASEDSQSSKQGFNSLMTAGICSAVISLCSSGLKLIADSVSLVLPLGSTGLKFATSFSPALVGAGFLMGMKAGFALLVGLLVCWLVIVPLISLMATPDAGLPLSAFIDQVWRQDVRILGAGLMAVAAVWTLCTLAKSIIEGIKISFQQRSHNHTTNIDRQEQDLPSKAIILISAASFVALFAIFYYFLTSAQLHSGTVMLVILALIGTVFAMLFSFLVASACGYMAGLIGASSSPISGIGIVAVILISLLIGFMGIVDPEIITSSSGKIAIGLVLFATSVVIAASAIANDNLQDLKTGQLVGATPWRQQLALIVGCIAGALVIPPVLELLYNSYGFVGAVPNHLSGDNTLSAPQAVLMTNIAQGIFNHNLNWSMFLTGLVLGVVFVVIDILVQKISNYKYSLPPLCIGLGIYLPPTINMTIVFGALISMFVSNKMQQHHDQQYVAAVKRKGALLCAGLIVGESLMGILFAIGIGVTGNENLFAIIPPGFNSITTILGTLVFVGVLLTMYKRSLAVK